MKQSLSCCSWLLDGETIDVPKMMFERTTMRLSSNRSSFSDFDARRKRANTYAKARTKTFRMVKKKNFFFRIQFIFCF
jgi:Zn-finger nucleic acid-binding protein